MQHKALETVRELEHRGWHGCRRLDKLVRGHHMRLHAVSSYTSGHTDHAGTKRDRLPATGDSSCYASFAIQMHASVHAWLGHELVAQVLAAA